jgi:hypothetical protein
MQVKDVGERVRVVPALGQPGLQLVVLIFFDQRIEDEHVNALGLRIHTHARIEAGGAGFDEHDGGIRIGLAAASGEDHCT